MHRKLGALSLLLILTACFGPSTGPSRLAFSTQELRRNFELRLRISETPLAHDPYDNDFLISGSLVATPVRQEDPAVYRVRLEQFLLQDREGRLLIAFDQPDEESVRYSSDAAWSSQQRAALFAAFEVDLDQTDPFDDNSLLREQIQVAVRANAQIVELTLSNRLRSVLQRLSQGRVSSIFLREMLARPDQIPALLPEKASSSWESHGSCVTPLHWVHRRSNTGIQTRSVPTAMQKVNGYDVQSDVQIDWDYQDGAIPQLEAKIYLALSRSLMGSESRAACWFDLRLAQP